MNTIMKTAFAAALLLSVAPALADESHHPAATDAPATSPSPKTTAPQAPTPSAGSGMPGGMMGGDMMKMMQEMMAAIPG